MFEFFKTIIQNKYINKKRIKTFCNFLNIFYRRDVVDGNVMVESEETVSQEFPLLTRGLKRKGIKKIRAVHMSRASPADSILSRPMVP